jgi:uncharacterized protein YdaU (DUF1376 family)
VNYYPFHIGDYASATRHLSWDEDCAYRRLLDAYYTSEKPLPPNCAPCAGSCSPPRKPARSRDDRTARVLGADRRTGWVNRRADLEIEAMREKQQKQREKANKRWQKPKRQNRHCIGNAAAWRKQCRGIQKRCRCNATNTNTNTNTNRRDSRAGCADADQACTQVSIPGGIHVE